MKKREHALVGCVTVTLWLGKRLVFSNGAYQGKFSFWPSHLKTEREREHFSKTLRMIDGVQNTSHVYCNVTLLITDNGLHFVTAHC